MGGKNPLVFKRFKMEVIKRVSNAPKLSDIIRSCIDNVASKFDFEGVDSIGSRAIKQVAYEAVFDVFQQYAKHAQEILNELEVAQSRKEGE